MRAQRRFGALVSLAACCLMLACNGEAETGVASDAVGTESGAGADTEREQSGQPTPLVLDLSNRSALYPIGSEIAGRATAAKIIEVTFDQLINPDRVRVVFEMHYRPESGDDVRLGSFGPFPPDNPGTYLVATEGVIKEGGALVITVTPLDPVSEDQELRVVLKDPVFRRQ